MGLSVDSTRFLVDAWQSGVRFDEVLTLGRQHMMVGPERLETMLREAGAWPPPSGEKQFRDDLSATTWRFDIVARALGAQKISSSDASAYEGATHVHDLNQPVPEHWHEKFDVVLDGGTLEHVFNFPVAIANCMNLVKTGGHLLLFTPTNNYCGHGFYQFSPELLYRVLSPENGFKVVRMVAVEDSVASAKLVGVTYPFAINGPWHEVRDPADVGRRVELINHKPTLLMVLAQKTSRRPLFGQTPQQSDYVPQWHGAPPVKSIDQPRRSGGCEAWLRSKFSETFCRETIPRLALLLNPLRTRSFLRSKSFQDRSAYKRTP
jgi:SAM-dependent methyltransferase